MVQGRNAKLGKPWINSSTVVFTQHLPLTSLAMPRDYKNIKKEAQKKQAPPAGSFLNFFSGLSLGLFIAVIVFFYGDDISEMIKVERKGPSIASNIGTGADSQQPPDVPEPTFEFYNILPNKEVDISAWMEQPQQNTPAPSEQGNYILQVGSFRKNSAADQVKARLALLGFEAYIEPGVINGEGVYRVRIGPYSNLSKLKSVRERLLANNLDFMEMRL